MASEQTRSFQNKVHTSPKGTSVYPKLVKPDTKFDKDGVYSTKMRFSKEVEEALIAYLTPLAEQGYALMCQEKKKKTLKKADLPWAPEVEKIKDDEGVVIEERPTGFMLFNFKLKAKGKKQDGSTFDRKPTLFDGGTPPKPIKGDISIGGGSILKIAYQVVPFYTTDKVGAGITLRIKGAQIIELVEFGGVSAASCGFGAEDGGYVDDSGDAPSGPPSAGAPDPTDSDF